MKRIQAADVLFLDAERPNAPPLIGGLFILDPSTAPGSFVRHRDILQYVQDRLHLAPNLRKKLKFSPLKIDEPRLIDDPNFDLEFHVRHIGLPRPRDARQLKILCARLMSRPMDLHRPLWEMYIIEGLEDTPAYSDDAFAMMIKVHHAAFDGAAAGAAIWAMVQNSPDEQPAPPEKPWLPEREPGAVDWAVSAATEAFTQTISNLQAMPGLGRSAFKGLTGGGGEGDLTAPQTRFQKPVSSHRVFDWITFSQPSVQAIRKALAKPKMNDLVLTIIAGAMRRYLAAKGELPDKSLLAMCPINVRGTGDPREGGNQVSAMRVTLGTDIADPLARLQTIATNSAQGKKQAEQWGGTFFGDLLALYPYSMRSAAVRGLTALQAQASNPLNLANLIVTNIPNPPGGYYLAGSKVLNYAGFGPIMDNFGLFHTVAGMEWEMTISITSCREMMPDPAFYIECLAASFAEVEAAANAAAAGRHVEVEPAMSGAAQPVSVVPLPVPSAENAKPRRRSRSAG